MNSELLDVIEKFYFIFSQMNKHLGSISGELEFIRESMGEIHSNIAGIDYELEEIKKIIRDRERVV